MLVDIECGEQWHRTQLAALGGAPHWPCDTAPALDLFTILSGEKVSASLRRAVGRCCTRHGWLDTNEFVAAERRLEVD